MTEVVTIKWRFSPADYFEEALKFSYRSAVITIADTRIEAKIPADIFDADQSIRDSLHEHLNDRFIGVQLSTYTPYTLTRLHTTRVRSNGSRDITVELDTGSVMMAACAVDFQVIDKDGNTVANSVQARIDRKISLATMVSMYRPADRVLASMLRSFGAAIRDPDNELVHLYEIRDALSTKFSGEKLACEALSLGRATWERFGHLCNGEPLRQGRHRGKSSGTLRNASACELEEARNFARAMIEAYLRHLQSASAA